MSANPKISRPPKLLDQLRRKIRLLHYSKLTEDAHADWATKFILYRYPSGRVVPHLSSNSTDHPSIVRFTATAHKLARIVYGMVRYGVAYVKKTEEAYAEQVRERLERGLRRRAKELGYEPTPVEGRTAEPEPAPA